MTTESEKSKSTTKARSRSSEKFCKECGYRVRGAKHTDGRHHQDKKKNR